MDEGSPDESPDEGDSQVTDSVIGDPDIYLDYQSDCSNTARDRNTSFTTSNTVFSTLEVNQDEDSDGGDFIPVQNSRRPVLSAAKPSNGTSSVQKQFGERASGLDWIDAPPGEEFQLSSHEGSTNLRSESVDDFPYPSANERSFSSIAKTEEKPQTVAKVKALPLTPEPKTSQLHDISPSVGFRMEVNANTSEVRRSLSFDEFPSLAEGSINRSTPTSMHMGTSGNALVNINPPEASLLTSSPFQSEVRPRKPTNEQLSSMYSQEIPGQTSSSTGFACFTSPGQSDRSSTPVTFSQSFQTNRAMRKLSVDPPPGLSCTKMIPEGVFVECEHFRQDFIESRTCKFCEERGMLKYATWNKNRYHWQVMRPFP